ncbi:MAG TPA: Rieske (2Fe-2S) protein, partial [Rectinemataceae bacterium]|nr:Rieske (2Fe-2S) protein [Rectinemataceae bacterium]
IKVSVKGTEIMLANVGGAIYALENRCPHMGGSLADGVVEGSAIKCPRHGAKFDLTTGKNIGQAKVLFIKMNVKDAKSYKVEVRGAEVFVELP